MSRSLGLHIVFFFLPGTLFGEAVLQLDARDSSFSPVAHSYYYVEQTGKPVENIRALPESEWVRDGRGNLKNLKNQFNDVWIRFDLLNKSNSTDWVYWTRIHWQEHRPEGYCINRTAAGGIAGATGQAIDFVHFGGRQHVFKMTLPGEHCRVYVRVRTQLSKIIALKLSRTEVYQTESISTEFLNGLFFFCLAAMLLLNLLFFAKYRAVPALIYAGALLFFGIWQSVNFGYAERTWIFGEFMGIERTGIVAPGLFGILLIFFWKKLLFLRAYAPGINRLLNFLLVPSVALLLGAAFLLAPLSIISRVSKTLFIFIALVLFAAAWVAARRGFRPAIFSFWGNLVFVLALLGFFSFTSLHFLPAFEYVLYIPFTGFLFEALFFFISLVSRQKIIDHVGKEGIVQAALESRESERRRFSRLAGTDINGLKEKLYHAMSEKKLYREDLTLGGLAVHLGLTEKELSELLNSHLHQSFYSMVNQYRVEEACQLLVQHTDRTVLSIGFEVGFKSLSTFNSAFSKQMNMSPRNYRKTAGSPANDA